MADPYAKAIAENPDLKALLDTYLNADGDKNELNTLVDRYTTAKAEQSAESPVEQRAFSTANQGPDVDFNKMMIGPRSLAVYDMDLFTAILDGRGLKQAVATEKVAAFRKAENDFRNALDKIRNP